MTLLSEYCWSFNVTSTGTSNFSYEGGVTHSNSVDDKTLAGLFPKDSNWQKVSFSSFKSLL